MQFDFTSGKGTIDTMFMTQQIQKKRLAKNKIMNTFNVEIRTLVSWELIFAYDIALVAAIEELQRKVLNWHNVLRKGGLKMTTQKS